MTASERQGNFTPLNRERAEKPNTTMIDRPAWTHELSGGAIANVRRSTILAAFRKDIPTNTEHDIEHGIARELRKEGRGT